MTSVLRISEATSLGMHAMVLMAHDPHGPISCKEIAASLHVSHAHLSKVLQRLSRLGLLRSVRGAKGGFMLARPAERIALLHVYEAIEGPVPLSDCIFAKPLCENRACVLGELLGPIHAQFVDCLAKTRLSDLTDRSPRSQVAAENGATARPSQDSDQAPSSRGEVTERHRDDREAVRDRLISAMKETFGDDQQRIGHAMKVLSYAEDVLAAVGDDRTESASPLVVQAAAILHDIGIQEAERKHGSSAGRYQEMEGPPIARRIMEQVGLDERTMEHVCRIVGSHHSAKGIDTPEFRIVWDADWLVNIPEEFPDRSQGDLRSLIDRVFKTRKGREIAHDTFLGVGTD